jgi:hypothetical protein
MPKKIEMVGIEAPGDIHDSRYHTWTVAVLILTNGDSAADTLRAAGKAGTIVPWQDVLHEGPIASGTIEGCSAVRVNYLARRFGIDAADIAAGFAERDGLLRAHAAFSTVELWFEHDLYDQLQLAQILAFLAAEPARDGLVLVQADDFLGPQTADTILRFADRARPIVRADVDLATATWAALTAPTPEAVGRLASTSDTRLPFLMPALRRFLEELPAPGTGLSRTEAVTLDAIGAGVSAPRELFQSAIRQEEAAFMGDASFFHLLDDLAFCEVPLLTGLSRSQGGEDNLARFADASLELTMAGENVLAGEEDHVALSSTDRWWGGTRLLGRDVWRYDREAMALVSPGSPGA